MFHKKPPTDAGPPPYKERMELVYSEDRYRHESRELPDRELAIAARGGDVLAFEVLVLRKTPAVVSVARRIVGNVEDARDVAQMAFLRVWERLSRYDETYSFNTWLYRIATNLSIDFLRSARSRERAHTATLHLVRLRESEIAAILNCGESTVRNHLFNARRVLRREIEKSAPGLHRPTLKAGEEKP